MVDQDGSKTMPPAQASVKLRKIGTGLIVLSFAWYGLILLVPFLSFSGGVKIVISSVLAILGELSFWVGCLILGKEVAARYKQYLNPLRWFKKRS